MAANGEDTPMEMSTDPMSTATTSNPASSTTANTNGTAANTANSSNTSKKVGDSAMKKVHKESGYEWEKDEDAPGYAWKSKRAQEEAQRSWDGITGQKSYIGRKFEDRALLAPISTPYDQIT